MRKLGMALALTGTVGAGLLALATPAAAAVPACGNASLDYSRTSVVGFGGTGAFALQYRNHTHALCSLRGYPGLDAVAANGALIAHAARTVSGQARGSTNGVQTIILAPGEYASAVVEWKDRDCVVAARINTIAPNTTKLISWRGVPVTGCYLQVHPVVRGWRGSN